MPDSCICKKSMCTCSSPINGTTHHSPPSPPISNHHGRDCDSIKISLFTSWPQDPIDALYTIALMLLLLPIWCGGIRAASKYLPHFICMSKKSNSKVIHPLLLLVYPHMPTEPATTTTASLLILRTAPSTQEHKLSCRIFIKKL